MTTPSHRPVYLRPDVQVDPLIHNWYAWVQIIPPASAAFNVLDRQIKAMKSFVASPNLHIAALKNPDMRGGPFIDLPASETGAVRELLDRMASRTERQAEFVQAVRSLDELLDAEADGWTLQRLYDKVPPILKGVVELIYDRHHRPDFRIIEPLLYDSPLYDETAQSLALSRFDGDGARRFIFSTPRLDCEGSVRVPLPFRSKAYDRLFGARAKPAALAELADALRIASDDMDAFSALFTEEPPPSRPAFDGESPRIRYFGHACVLVETRDCSILVDPLVPYPASTAEELPRFSYDALPERIDYVLITHGHHDHIMLETLLQLRHRIGTIVVAKNAEGNLVDPSLKLMLERLGFERVVEAGIFDSIELADGRITTLPFMGEHHDLAVHSKVCYHVRLGGRTLLFAADSCNFGHGVYERMPASLREVDALFIGMECEGAPVSWVYGPAFSKKPERERDRSRRGRGSDSDEALGLVETLGCKQVYVYAMGSEPWIQYVLDVHYRDDSPPIVHSKRFVEACRQRGIHAERLHGAKQIRLD